MPTFSFGCRRVTPADPYMRAVQQPNVYVHFAAAEELTESTIIDANGDRFEVDTVVCATGKTLKIAQLRLITYKDLTLNIDAASQLSVEMELNWPRIGATTPRHTWVLQYQTCVYSQLHFELIS